ncbi:MAG: hypothetical protein ACI9K1_001646, partial [Arcticibacterium sp.]
SSPRLDHNLDALLVSQFLKTSCCFELILILEFKPCANI